MGKVKVGKMFCCIVGIWVGFLKLMLKYVWLCNGKVIVKVLKLLYKFKKVDCKCLM